LKTRNSIRWSKRFIQAITVGCSLVTGLPGLAHDGPEHDIEELTERMAKEGESTDLLLQRAIEYNVLGKFTEAAKDLERALQFDPDSLTVQRELSRAYFASGKTDEALKAASRGLKNPAAGPDYASLLMVRAEILRARGEHQKALDDADLAIEEYPNNVEWYLVRSQLQSRLKLKKERLNGLEEGIKETGSGVLEIEWIDALIDDGQHPAALERIETELKNSRWRSSWLIRRAKIRLAAKNAEEATADLETAITELNRRINPTSPDPSLLADRGQAQDLLGKKEEARKDYEQARDKGLSEDWLRERIRLLKEAEDAEKDEDTKKPARRSRKK
jgi:tetratricopeptide (TPR) repeat protein